MRTLYEIVIGKTFETNKRYSKLILSNEPLCESNTNIYSIVNLNSDEYIIKIQTPLIYINAWDASEFYELDRIRKELI